MTTFNLGSINIDIEHSAARLPGLGETAPNAGHSIGLFGKGRTCRLPRPPQM